MKARRKTSRNSVPEVSVAYVQNQKVVWYIWLVVDASGDIVEASHDKNLLPECGKGERMIKIRFP